MNDEAFDSFNAPQFVDFSKKHEYFEDSTDTFFDVDHENESKSEIKSDPKKRLSSGDAYFSPLTEFDTSVTCKTEEILEFTYEETKHSKLRKSMSVGNLILFSEEEYREEYKPILDEICETVKIVHISNKEEKSKVKKACTAKSTNSYRKSSQSWKGSQDHLNKLAQPKHYASVENLKRGNTDKYVSFAEAIDQFQNRTPVRFRSKPNLHQLPSQPLTRTVPESPALQTKARSRPNHLILSHEEREQIEFDNLQKFKIKANPVNKKALHGPVKPLAPVEKKAPTKPEPFKLTSAPPKKVMPSPKKFEFHARPMPRSAEKSRRTQVLQRREMTKPVTPTFMKNYKAPSHKSEVNIENNKVPAHHDERPRGLTKPKPFSFEQRDKMVQRKRQQLIQKMEEEERRAREFHAKPIPKSIYNRGDSTRSDSGSSLGSSKKRDHSSDYINTNFKARPPTVLYKEPFVPAKAEKPPTQVVPFQLSGELRSYEREEFERERRLKAEKLEFMKQLEEEKRLRDEQEEIARIRRETQYKAKPIKKYKELIILPSGKVTEPISPNFHSNLLRKMNKENIPDNSS